METEDDDDTLETPASWSLGAELAAAVEARAFPGLVPAGGQTSPRVPELSRLGRFVVLSEIGRGGMGIVYACYDEKLDRKIAVKLLVARIEDETRCIRLEREGQALARLSHPNVVQIYELGEHYGAPFVAMEFVVGQTLRRWFTSQRDLSPRQRWREVAAMLRQAGTGLEAAHAAGLVHRDFKPDNVIIGADGRARVLDFGLVRYAPEPSEVTTEDSSDPDAVTQTDDALGLAPTGVHELTRRGTVMGTPAYMAPEQLGGRPCDAASDQFSFCVAAFEALFGQRPFAGRSLSALSTAIANQEIAPIPASTLVPRRLQAAVLRGLAPKPEARWPDMSSLLAEFDQVLSGGERRARLLALGFGLGAMIIAVSAALVSSPEQPQLCSFDTDLLAGVWDDERRAALRGAYEGDALPFADESIAQLDGALSAWGQRWLESQRRNCEATRVQGSQSEELLDRRSSCLERQRREVASLTDELLEAGAAGLGRGFELLELLPDVARCEDPDLVDESHPLPSEPDQREAIWVAYEQISRVRAQRTLARVERADATLAELEARVPALAHLPLTLELGVARAELELERGQIEFGVTRLRELVREAEIAGLDEISATVRTELALVLAGHWGGAQLQLVALDEAQTAVARVGRDPDPRGLDLDLARAVWLATTGDLEGARAQLQAFAKRAEVRGDTLRLARAHQQLGRVLVELGQLDEAEAAYHRAEAGFVDVQGRGSLDGARVELDLAYLALERGAFDEAQTRLRDIRGRHRVLLEPGSDLAAMVELAEAKLASVSGDLDQAEVLFRRVAQSELSTIQRGEAWQAVGVLRFYAGDMQGSLAAYRRARVELSRTLGPDHPDMGVLESNIGESLAATGDHAAALAAYAAALATLETALAPDHPDLAFPYKGRGQSRLALGQLDAAREDLERALALHVQHPGESAERADVEFSLARVLLRTGERAPALALARTARERLESLGQERLSADIDIWLDEHDPHR